MDIFINPKLQSFINPDTWFNVVHGGRSSGKSWGIADILILKSISEKNKLFLCVKGTMRSIADSVKGLLEQTITRHGWDDYFYITDKEIICKLSGSRFIFYGLQYPKRLKSLEGVDYCWLEEATVDVSQEAINILFPTIRKASSKIYISYNPHSKEDAIYKMFNINNEPNSTVVELNYPDNPFLSDETLNLIKHTKATNKAKYLHIYEGKLKPQIEGALWDDKWFNYLSEKEIQRIKKNHYDVFEKIVVALDPSGTSNITSDTCGIIVVGKYSNIDRWCVLEDCTDILSPLSWAKKAVGLYNKYEANQIIYESNYGGDMVKTVIRSVNKKVPIDSVRATKGKLLRAEPIVSLYEQGLVDHFGMMVDLEFEYTTFDGSSRMKSPGRLDAAVWGLSYLFNSKPAFHKSAVVGL